MVREGKGTTIGGARGGGRRANCAHINNHLLLRSMNIVLHPSIIVKHLVQGQGLLLLGEFLANNP